MSLIIGLLKEGKVPVDRRVALTPSQARDLQANDDKVKIVAQSSPIRCYTDDDYRKEGVEVSDSVEHCDILLGVKEVQIPDLIPDKTFFFFSHTIKKQPYNKKLLQEILRQKIQLVDYEVLTDNNGKRIVAFGRYAGIVGAYNGILAFGIRFNLFHLKRAHECFDLDELQGEFKKVKLPPIKIILTGGGRVAKGAMEVLLGMGIRKVNTWSFLNERFIEPVFCQINPREYNKHKRGKEFDRMDFYKNTENYISDFWKFARRADLLIAAAFWDPRAPRLFTREEILREDFNIKVVADITCDINGSIPSTKKASSIEDPFYDYNPEEDAIEKPFNDEGNISVMAIDNLPCELPRNASIDFGHDLTKHLIPALLNNDEDGIIRRATIAKNGKLTDLFSYLEDYVR